MSRSRPCSVVCRRFAASDILSTRFLGLTPQANYLSPLRGSTDSVLSYWCGPTPQAMYLSPLRGWINESEENILQLRGSTDSVVSYWCGLTPQAMYLSPLRGWINRSEKKTLPLRGWINPSEKLVRYFGARESGRRPNYILKVLRIFSAAAVGVVRPSRTSFSRSASVAATCGCS